jgi:hypothetical protein
MCDEFIFRKGLNFLQMSSSVQVGSFLMPAALKGAKKKEGNKLTRGKLSLFYCSSSHKTSSP